MLLKISPKKISNIAERTLFTPPHILAALVAPHPLDFRNSAQWIYRYESANRPRWEKQADKLRAVYNDQVRNANSLFLSTSPDEKRKLIELMSIFGKPEDGVIAGEMIAGAMQLYSDPCGGTNPSDQQDFYGHELTTKPPIFLHALDIFFEKTRQNSQRQEYLDIAITIRAEHNPHVADPYFEQEFIKKQIGGIGSITSEQWAEHYEKNHDMYAFFGLAFDEETRHLIKLPRH